MKKILSIILTLVLVCCIAFECSTQSSAAFGVDDAILIGTVALDLLSLGITFHSASEFVQSDTFKVLCNSISHDIDQGIRVVKRNGKLFFATAKMVWDDIVSWVKGKFKPAETITFHVDTHIEAHPQTLKLSDGTYVPYAAFMENPFFIYKTTKYPGIYAWYCDGQNPGVNFNYMLVRMWCTGTGTVYRYELVNGAWSGPVTHQMTYGMPYKDGTGSFYDLNFMNSLETGQTLDDIMQYRTMDLVTDTGIPMEEQPPDLIPPVGEIVSVPVTATSDAVYYPGAVDSPTETISEGEEILIPVPDNMIVEAGTVAETITTDPVVIGNTIADTVPAEVNPRVLTQTSSVSGTIDQVITDTPSVDIEAGVNDPTADLETANKFRLPRSFLEGFPFSIPYSVYVGIQSLVADPQVPTFNIPFSIPRLGISENVDIDLSQFSPVARLCRALLSLVWVAGLAMACTKFIKR